MGAAASVSGGSKISAEQILRAKTVLQRENDGTLECSKEIIREMRKILRDNISEKKTTGTNIKVPSILEPPSFKSRMIVYHNKDGDNIWEKYKKRNTVGFGLCGAVHVVEDRRTGQRFACKSVLKKYVKLIHDLRSEIKMLQTLDHPNIIKMYEAWESKKHVYLILELAEGGDLFDNLMRNESYSEKDAALIFRQMLSAIQYCHENGVTHRDIKLENFLFCKTPSDHDEDNDSISSSEDDEDGGNTSEGTLKLIDFGLSKRFIGSGIARMRSTVGTSYYVAPEVLKKKQYGNECDMWSLGVVLFMLLSGKSPWLADTEPAILSAVVNGKYVFVESDWVGISDSARDLVKKLLCIDPNTRLTATQALAHPWMKEKKSQQPLRAPEINVFESLKNFSGFSELKKVVIDVIAFSLDSESTEESQEYFHYIDSDGNGTISVDELRNSLKSKGVPESQINDVFDSIDQDHNGTISFSEFLAATLDRSKYLKNERLAAAFQRLDADHDGKISISDLKESLGDWYEADEIEHMIKDLIQDESGVVDFKQFLRIMYDGENDHAIPLAARKASGELATISE